MIPFKLNTVISTGLAFGLLAIPFIPAHASPDLAKQNTCMGCHAMDRKVVGPSYKAIAARYQSQPRAQMVDTLATKIRLGGGGAWGVVVMPANTKISEVDAKKLAEWILDSNK
ncbi:MAG: cytochrome C' [Polynucleobacter sp.]|jgi:cytochrome c|uniref:c-type cytochrome n=1 Tax=Polynucleobacter sp. TaxID=2029855 RepID=UPI002717000A|nr:c-type cytochrome [Polynucleobacter sp.]MDO9014071.1 cytochrome C' [Polynucleobacter sp.]MDP3121982.1 cytochrome C' [Polynucleobacter sp.]